MQKAYKSLPNVKSTKRIDKDTIQLETYSGKKYDYALHIFRRKTLNFPEYYKQTVDQSKRFAKYLSDGGALFFTKRSGDLTVTRQNGAKELVAALNFARSPENRLAAARKLGFGNFYKDNPIITSYKGSPQLTARLLTPTRPKALVAKLIDDSKRGQQAGSVHRKSN